MTGFTSRYRNFISQEQVSGSGSLADPLLYQFVNLDRVRVEGVEARFRAQADSGIYGNLSIAYADGTVTGLGSERVPLTSIDPLKVVAGIEYREPAGRFGAQIIMTHSARKELSSTTGTDGAGAPTTICSGAPCFRPDDYTILDATAFVRILDAVTLRAGIFNILDTSYIAWSDVRGLSASSTVTDAYTQPGRNASVSLSYRF